MRSSQSRLAAVAITICLTVLTAANAHAAWLPLGDRWAIQTDSKGRALAIDDLSYGGLLGRVTVGRVDPAKRNAGNNGGARAASAPEADPEWWRAIPWKDTRRAMSVDAPRVFRLSDIDLEKSSKDPRKQRVLIQRMEKVAGKGFLDGFQFVRSPNGEYEIQWEAPAANTTVPGGIQSGKVLRVVELGSIKNNLWRNLGTQVAEMAVCAVVGLIPVPVLSALLGTALDRFFHWRKLLIANRQEALAEMLTDPPEGFELAARDRDRAAQGLLYARTPLLESFKWIWKRPLTEWRKRLSTERSRAARSRKWLADHGVYAKPLSTGFDWQPPLGKVYLSGWGLPWSGTMGDGPLRALDPEHPARILTRRITVEAATTLAVFTNSFIPFVGSIVTMAFKQSVEVPEDQFRGWESRLAMRLELRQRTLGESWEPELEQLALQQANPVELTRVQTRALVTRRRAELGFASIGGSATAP